MSATILVTGATGLIGFRILLAALADGHEVRYMARSEEKAQKVSSNPAVRKLEPGDRLSPVIVPDFTVNGAFDHALRGVTHVIYAGSPVPYPTHDPTTQIFEPTVKMSSNLLSAALKYPSVQRVVITSSIVANLGLSPPQHAVSANTRVPLSDPLPSAFGDVFEGYTMGKIVELHSSDEFVRTRNPHFTVSHVMPGYIFGRNELALDTTMMRTENSSNNFLIVGMLGGELPFPIHGGYAHVDDVADAHMRVAFLTPEPGEIRDFGVANKVDYGTIFDHVAKAFPKAVESGVFRRGTVPMLPMAYDSSDVAELLGGKFRSFESAVVDVAGQYLEKLDVDKA